VFIHPEVYIDVGVVMVFAGEEAVSTVGVVVQLGSDAQGFEGVEVVVGLVRGDSGVSCAYDEEGGALYILDDRNRRFLVDF
jgi:hypothetical protein